MPRPDYAQFIFEVTLDMIVDHRDRFIQAFPGKREQTTQSRCNKKPLDVGFLAFGQTKAGNDPNLPEKYLSTDLGNGPFHSGLISWSLISSYEFDSPLGW